MSAAETVLDLDPAQIKMVVFWKVLNELDVYTAGKVQTFTGEVIAALLESLRSQQIPIEIMD